MRIIFDVNQVFHHSDPIVLKIKFLFLTRFESDTELNHRGIFSKSSLDISV